MTENILPAMVLSKIKVILADTKGLTAQFVQGDDVGYATEGGHEIKRNGRVEFTALTQFDRQGRVNCRLILIDGQKYMCPENTWQEIKDLITPISLKTIDLTRSANTRK